VFVSKWIAAALSQQAVLIYDPARPIRMAVCVEGPFSKSSNRTEYRNGGNVPDASKPSGALHLVLLEIETAV